MTPIPLSKSDFSTKVLITLFLVTMLIAMVTAELNVWDKIGRVKSGIAARYGPEVDLPPIDESNQVSPESFPSETELPVVQMNTYTALLDITHPHIFQIPMMIFVLAHFLMRTRTRQWFKLVNYIASFGGAILFMAAPWTVRYISVRTAPVLYAGAGLLGISSFVMILVPLWDMWRPHPGKSTR